MNCLGDDISEQESLEKLQTAIDRLPEPNIITLSFFLRFMYVVASKEDENKMGTKNLGVVFGSILLGGAVLCFSLGLKTTLQRQNTIVQLMIDHVHTLFPKHKFEDFFGPEESQQQPSAEEEEYYEEEEYEEYE